MSFLKKIAKRSRPVLMLAAIVAGAAVSVAFTQQEAQPVVTHRAVIKTSLGDVEVELYGLDAPKTVKNFVELAKKGFYNGILFHRVVPSFVVQAGDPLTKDPAKDSLWGTGGESVYGGVFADELNPNAPSYQRGYTEGVMAMANRGPNTNTSQFFIMLADRSTGARALPKNYTIFGKVTKGMDIVRKMEQIERNEKDVPRKNISIVKIDAVEVKPAAR